MTIVKIAFLTNYNKFRKLLENITTDEYNNYNKFIIKYKKLYKFINIKIDNNKVYSIFLFHSIVHYFVPVDYVETNKINPPEDIHLLSFNLLVWNLIYKIQFLNEYEKYLYKYFIDGRKNCFAGVKNNIISGNGIMPKNLIRNSNYYVETILTGGIDINEFNDNCGHDINHNLIILCDYKINTFMLLNNLLYYLENNYKNNNSKITDYVDITVKYNDNKNCKKMNVIKTCLPINSFMKNLILNKQLKLHKNIRMKIMKIIHVLCSYGMHENIIGKII